MNLKNKLIENKIFDNQKISNQDLKKIFLILVL